MKGQIRKVVHLEYAGEHYYFGSIKALSSKFGKDKIGISYGGLTNAFYLSGEKTFKNKLCTIRIGMLDTQPKFEQKKPKSDKECGELPF